MHEIEIRPTATMSAAAVLNAIETRPTVTALRRTFEILSIAAHADARRSSPARQHFVAAEMPNASWHSTCTGTVGEDIQPIGSAGVSPAGDQTVIRLWEGVHCRPPVCFDA